MENGRLRFWRSIARTCFIIGMVMAPSFSATASSQRLPFDSLQRRFVDLRFGMFIHFNMNTFSPGWANARVNPKLFNPTNLNCAQWAAAAKSAKMTYGMLTCKHHDGFTLWPCKQTPPNGNTAYTIAQSSVPDSDVVKSYVTAFRAAGLLPGLYMSIWDVAQGIAPDACSRWNAGERKYVLGQITELLSNYGEIPIFWFDGYSWKTGHYAVPWQDIRDTIKKLQPNCLIVETNGIVTENWESDASFFEEDGINLCGSGNKLTGVQASSISGDWFWNSTATSGSTLKSVDEIVNQRLKKINPYWCNYQLNCPPNRQGLMDSAIVNRLAAVGAAWSPDLSRPPLPAQPKVIEQPYTPVSVTATSGNACYAVDSHNDRANVDGGYFTAFTRWESSGALPQSVTMDLGKVYTALNALYYLPRRELNSSSGDIYSRQVGANTTGNITSYDISVSTDNSNFTLVTSGTWTSQREVKRVYFPNQTCRYVRFTAKAANGGSSAVANDIGVGDTTPNPPIDITAIKGLPAARAAFQSRGMIITAAVGSIDCGPALCGMEKSVAVYDLGGKLLGRKTMRKNGVDLRKDFGLSGGVYVVKVQSLE